MVYHHCYFDQSICLDQHFLATEGTKSSSNAHASLEEDSADLLKVAPVSRTTTETVVSRDPPTNKFPKMTTASNGGHRLRGGTSDMTLSTTTTSSASKGTDSKTNSRNRKTMSTENNKESSNIDLHNSTQEAGSLQDIVIANDGTVGTLESQFRQLNNSSWGIDVATMAFEIGAIESTIDVLNTAASLDYVDDRSTSSTVKTQGQLDELNKNLDLLKSNFIPSTEEKDVDNHSKTRHKNRHSRNIQSISSVTTSNSTLKSLGTPTNDKISFSFPPTTKSTRGFVHGICVLGASSAEAVSNNPELTYTMVTEFRSGSKLWDDRNYIASNVTGNEMCQGGIYLRPSKHKVSETTRSVDNFISFFKKLAKPIYCVIEQNIYDSTTISVEVISNSGGRVTLCAFIATDGRDGQWDQSLPAEGFTNATSATFDFSFGTISGEMKSYCKRIGPPPTPGTVLYRIANAGYTGWRPAVREFWMKEANGLKIENAKLICSGSHRGGCQNAVDMVSPWWRPHCHPCQPNNAWIGYEVDKKVTVGSAFAQGLGTGGGRDATWDGGVILQKSDNGGETWKDIASAVNSDLVDVNEGNTMYIDVPDMSDQDKAKVMNWIKAKTISHVTPMCWKDSYGRGVGEPLSTCPAHKEKIGALCYSKCPSGYKRFGFDCHSVCPVGFRDDGLFCRLSEYGRGVGYPWKFGDPLNNSGMLRRCQHQHGRGNCEMSGLIAYPKCRRGYHSFGCCICRPNKFNCADYGLNKGIDISCGKKIIIGDPTPMTCPGNLDKSGALCYPKCREGFYGVGPVCWSKCDKVDCGAACAESASKCISGTFDEVFSVAVVAANIASLGLTSAATEGAELTIKFGEKIVIGESRLGKLFVKAVKAVQTYQPIEGNVVKETKIVKRIFNSKFGTSARFVTFFKKFSMDSMTTYYDFRRAFADDFAKQTSQEISDELDNHFIPETARFLKEEFAGHHFESLKAQLKIKGGIDAGKSFADFIAMFDITGISGLIASYTKPICEVIAPLPNIESTHHSFKLQATNPPEVQQHPLCYNLKFTTENHIDDASIGDFQIDGYGHIPLSCHNKPGALCDLQVCNIDSLVIHDMSGNDGWRFTITGDIEAKASYKTTLLDSRKSSPTVEFSLTRNCYNFKFTTKDHADDASTGDFEIDGYGLIPKSCHDVPGASCDIQVCNIDSLVIHDLSGNDGWLFTISGDVNTKATLLDAGQRSIPKVEFFLLLTGKVRKIE